MRKAKIMAVVLSATLVFTSSSVCFAAEGIDGEQIQAEATAELVEDITGTADINKDIEETSDGFEVEGESVDVTLPEDGDGNIVMDSEEESIGMGLPKEVQDEEGILTDEGTVIYGATQDVSVAVQAGKEEQEDGMTFEFTRALVTIDNADAPKEYSFKFDLPEGYKLVTDKEYCEKYATEEEKEWYNSLEDGFANELYVLDADNQIVQTIDPAWAKDANGNDVDSYYEIKGDELVQVVNFDEDTAFPVVADPTTRPDKYKYTSVSKETIKKLRDSYAPNVTLGKLATYLGILSAGAITDPVVAVWVSTAVAQYEQYKVTHYDFYSATYKALVKKKKSYVRFKMRYVYRKKQGGVYVLYKIFEDDYTNTKGEDRVVYK